ncbi:MarR family transcriptional regulator [Ferruginivarius sediminum]|uniref:MarR family transcriptional regulator n=2 Tax=Ferruginivarius sediminum TaxID=2661937 RepID=A0A369TAZ7_9PROT|nr:MarR family transcriptional regulator [Ferruginivarius sediminum]
MPNGTELTDLMTQFVRAYLNNAYSGKLRPSQWEVIRFLADAPERDRTVSGVARHQRTTLGTASITVSALERRGLVRRGERRRAQPLELTEEGLAVLERDPIARLEEALGGLEGEEQAALSNAMHKGLRVLETDGQGVWRGA